MLKPLIISQQQSFSVAEKFIHPLKKLTILDKEEEEDNFLMAENIQDVKIVDTVTYVVNGLKGPETAHINKWSNGTFTAGRQNTESDDPRDVLSRLSSGDKNTEEIQAKWSADFERLVSERVQPKSE